MQRTQRAKLERRKFFSDPLMVGVILILVIFLMLFILYPLAMLMTDSVYAPDSYSVYQVSQSPEEIKALFADEGKDVQVLSVDRKTVLQLEDITGLTLTHEMGKTASTTYMADILKVELPGTTVAVKNDEGLLSLQSFPHIFRDYTFRRAFTNTVGLGMITGVGAMLVGLLFAYVDCYVKTRSRVMKKMFDIVSLLPVVSPPFVLSLSMILLFGKAGLVTRKLLGIYDSDVYGLSGIAIVQIMTFFPVCYLMLKGLLKNIDPSMEEASRDMGASRWKVFTTVTLPLMLPGLGNAFLVTFIESVADFANPMLIGGSYDTLATTIYLRITGGSYDTQGAAAMAIVLLSMTVFLFIVQKYYLESKTAATLTGKASRPRMPITERSVTLPLTTLCALASAFVILMYVAIPFGSLFKLWGRDYSLSFKWYEQLIKADGLKAFKDSFILSFVASPITALLSMIIAYLVVKKRFFGKGFIEFVSILAMAVPGTVLGVGFIRGFANGVFRTGFLQELYGTGAILVIVFIVRSLPVGTRSGISALRQIHPSIEESAYDLGAGSGKVFTSVTLPLIKESFFSGLVTTFVRSITAISAIILLVTPRYLLITTRINEFAEKGSYGVACAYATILIAIVYSAILIMNLFIKYFGTSKQVREAQKDVQQKRREASERIENL
ncbi:MAG: iron ABC transporter permease [Eubacteriales bacterium]|jgi:iron(III) transport system permease protein|nr:iron ABC transporter permease [Eubacteriales bacterium]MDD4104657.1 iron ABC transporter permease [Eubacteriales bacterium]